MIGVGDGRPEQGHDPVAHDLIHGASRPVHGLHQSLDHAVQHLPRLFEVVPGEELHRAAHVREQHGEIAPLAAGGGRGHRGPAAARLLVERAVDPPEEPVGLLPLLEVVEGAEAHRFLGRLPTGVGGQQDHVRVRAPGLRGLQDVEPEPVGHPEVGDDDVERIGAERARRGRHRVGLADQMAAVPEQQAERQPGGWLVVDDQDGGHGHGEFTIDATPPTLRNAGRNASARPSRSVVAPFQAETSGFLLGLTGRARFCRSFLDFTAGTGVAPVRIR